MEDFSYFAYDDFFNFRKNITRNRRKLETPNFFLTQKSQETFDYYLSKKTNSYYDFCDKCQISFHINSDKYPFICNRRHIVIGVICKSCYDF